MGEMLLSGTLSWALPCLPLPGVSTDTHQIPGASLWPQQCPLSLPSPRTHSPARRPPGPRPAPGGPESPAGTGGCGPGSCAPWPGSQSPAAQLKPEGGGPRSGLPVFREGSAQGCRATLLSVSVSPCPFLFAAVWLCLFSSCYLSLWSLSPPPPAPIPYLLSHFPLSPSFSISLCSHLPLSLTLSLSVYFLSSFSLYPSPPPTFFVSECSLSRASTLKGD